MALKYTGRADTFVHNGKIYVRDKNRYMREHGGTEPDGTFDKPIPNLTEADALHMIEQSNLHSFETTQGEDLLEEVTTPVAPVSVAPPDKEDKK